MKFNSYLRAITHTKDRTLFRYFLLAALRVGLVFVPQTGYIHPDEFFQTLEPMAGDEFQLEVSRPWEYNATFPIRSVVAPLCVIKLPFNVLRLLNLYSSHFLGLSLISSYSILVFPRLCVCLLSFVCDYSLFRMCRVYGLRPEMRLLVLGSSYVMLVFGTRTFSNTVEMILTSFLLCVVAECMLLSNSVIKQAEMLQDKYRAATRIVERVRIFKLKSALPSHSFKRCFLLSSLCVVGVFNRPTFIFFGMPIVFFWLLRGLGSRSVTFLDFNVRVGLFVLASVPALLVCTLVDSLYFGYLTPEEIEKLEIGIDNFVFTPLNFIRYNINPRNTAQHGLHPWYLHILVNIPLLFNILGVLTIAAAILFVVRFSRGEYSSLPRAQSILGLMAVASVTPTLLLSLINHQEARFLIPVLLPIVLLHAPKLQTGLFTDNPFRRRNFLTNFLYDKLLSVEAARKYLKIWYVVNILCTLFFGFLHQGGVLQLTTHFAKELETRGNDVNIHLVTSHLYSVPMSVLRIPSSKLLYTNPYNGQKYKREKRFFLYEYGGMDMRMLYRRLKLILDMSELKLVGRKQKYALFLAIPSSLTDDLNVAFYASNSTLMRHKQVKVFYPHLSTEAMPSAFVRHPCEVNTDFFEIDDTCSAYEDEEAYSLDALLRRFSSVIHQFGLVLYRIEVARKGS
ncbi:GPI mannosyltransferase 4 [Phlebotomus argentipes]|uniref:GPI mannosyltransferase 4 n=1 Tax=Phlebotomus argentipes TaxID=94469 RepID=UPI002893679B|nr:GPI mannosyltransferase 4 [Phlebotomus argentipes]